MEQAISGYHKVLVGRRGIQVKLILFSPNKQIVKKEFGELGLYGKDDPNKNIKTLQDVKFVLFDGAIVVDKISDQR